MFLKAFIDNGQIQTKLGFVSIEDLGFILSEFVTTPPEHFDSTGIFGQWSVDSNFLYVCVHTNLWRRFVGSSNW